MKLSKNFTLTDMTKSQTASRRGIDNTPSPEVIKKLTLLCENLLQPFRSKIRKPVFSSSGYRCKKLNKKIGGAKNSQHIKGEASDIYVSGMTTIEIIKKIVDMGLEFDQLIEEFGRWVHASYNEGNNRGIILQAYKKGRKTKYRKLEV